MSKSDFNLVLHTVHNVEQAKGVMDKWFNEKTIAHGEIFHFYLKPHQKPKTIRQNSTLYMLFNQLSETTQNEHAGNTPDWWKQYYKLKVYLPILRGHAIEDEDQEFLDIINSLGNVWRNAPEADKPAVESMIAGNEALSLSDATKDDLIKLIDVILKDAAGKGIYLEIKNKDYRE